MKRVFAIVVSYNGMKWFDRCLGSLRDSSVPISTIVVDNASNDGSLAYIENHFPEVHLIKAGSNLGFAKANNIGIRYAIENGADYVFLLNQDAWIETDSIQELLNTFEENEGVGIASPIHLNGTCSALDFGFVSYVGSDFVSDAFLQKCEHYYPLSFVNAAAWLVSRECIETVGGFDTLLFYHYGEDGNYCQRVHYHGFKIMLNTKSRICHDREDRRNDDYKFKSVAKRQGFLEQNLYLGNINLDFDFEGRIKKLKRKKKHKEFRLAFKDAQKVQKELDHLHSIVTSRSINKSKGPHWLYADEG